MYWPVTFRRLNYNNRLLWHLNAAPHQAWMQSYIRAFFVFNTPKGKIPMTRLPREAKHDCTY